MRNLKKFLALVLALMMVVSVMVTVSATSFTDDASIDTSYKEAVEVLTAVGVLGGRGDGTFDPKGPLNRAEAAKLISYLLIGTEADQLATAAVFDDVPVTYWGNRYINYVSLKEIVDPANANYRPTASVTGHEFGKMVLVALEYGDPAKYTNTPDWTINVSKDVKKMTAETSFSLKEGDLGTAPIARDAACQLLMAGLNYSPTGATTGKWEVTAGSASDKYKGQLAGLEFDSKNEAILAVLSIANEAVQGTDYNVNKVPSNEDSLADTTYNGLHSTSTPDDFGRPANTWVDATHTGANAYVKVAKTPLKHYVGKVTAGTLYTDLGLTANTSATVKTDGNTSTSSITMKKDDATNSVGNAGAVVDVYYDGADYNIYVMNYYAGKITGYTAADAKTEAKAYVNVTALTDSVTFATSGKFETDAFTKDDVDNGTIVYVTATTSDASNYTVKSAVAATKVTGKLTKLVGTTTATLDSTEYTFNAKAKQDTTTEVGVTCDLYLDANGNIIYAAKNPGAKTEPMEGIAYLLDVKTEKDSGDGWESTKGEGTNYAKLLLSTGEEKIVETTTAASSDDMGKLVFYYSADGGKTYKIVGTAFGATAVSAATDLKITAGKAEGQVSSDHNKVVFNDKTVFFLVSKGATEADPDTVKVVTGINNISDMVAQYSSSGTKTEVVALKSKTESDHSSAAPYQAVDAATDTVAAILIKYATAPAGEDVTDKDTYFIAGHEGANQITEMIGDTKVSYYVYNAVVNGKITTVKVSAEVTAATYVEGVTFVTGTTDIIDYTKSSLSGKTTPNIEAEVNAPADGVIKVGETTYTVKDNLVVFTYDKNGTITSIAASAIDGQDSGFYATKDGDLTALYLTKKTV